MPMPFELLDLLLEPCDIEIDRQVWIQANLFSSRNDQSLPQH
ncbi:MAG TPA: hypothetical protein VK897_02820 [Anaerolineales bacterium]|nr:hypothetical protein [Anaerolineales bacterium]